MSASHLLGLQGPQQTPAQNKVIAFSVNSAIMEALSKYGTTFIEKLKICTLYIMTGDPKRSQFTFLFSKKFRKYFTLLPVFYLIMWLMKSPKNFGKIAILKI